MKLVFLKTSRSFLLISGLMATLCHTAFMCGKVLIFTFAYNHPDFIELQHQLFQKFLKDEYEFVVFDDSKKQNN